MYARVHIHIDTYAHTRAHTRAHTSHPIEPACSAAGGSSSWTATSFHTGQQNMYSTRNNHTNTTRKIALPHLGHLTMISMRERRAGRPRQEWPMSFKVTGGAGGGRRIVGRGEGGRREKRSCRCGEGKNRIRERVAQRLIRCGRSCGLLID